MSEQIGWRGLLRTVRREAPFWAQTLPAIPRLVHRLLAEDRIGRLEAALERLREEGRRRNRLLAALVGIGAALPGCIAAPVNSPFMLVASVILYFIVTIAIGLWAAQRVHNSKDFLVAGRSLPMYMSTATVFATWFGAETVLSVSATFAKDGLGGIVADPFGSSFCLLFVALFFARAFYRMDLLTIGDYLPQALQQAGRADQQRRHYRLVPRLDLGPADRAGPGDLGALGRRHQPERGNRHRRA